MKRLAILATGSGSNAEKIMEHFAHSSKGKVVLVAANKSTAGVLARAQKFNVPTLTFTRQELEEGLLLEKLREAQVDWVILAGFLLKAPDALIRAFPNRMVNIHPALLPKYGGKGMYGHFVHEAVVAAGEKESGITIHYVNEHYDEGAIIFQSSFAVDPSDTPEDVARKGQVLEHRDFPRVIEELVSLPAST